MKTHKDFKHLILWQKADAIFHMVCADARSWSNERIANSIAFQLLDAAGSISANIAEGYGRGGPKEFEQFLRYSRGSMAEVENWLFKAKEQRLLTVARYEEYELKFEELRKISGAFIGKLRQQSLNRISPLLDSSIA